MNIIEEKQLRLRGVWLSPIEGCPHRRGRPEGPDSCEMNEDRICELELGKSCDLFREIIHEWQAEAEAQVVENCPNCGHSLEYFSGLENIPEYLHCPVCNDWAYTLEGARLARLE